MTSDWTWTRVGLITDIVRRGVSPSYTENNGMAVVGQKCVRDALQFAPEQARFTNTRLQPVSDELLLREGDSLINSTGDGTLGRVAFFPRHDRAMTLDSHVTLVRPNRNKADARFLAYLLYENENRFIKFSQGSTKQTELSRDVVLDVPFPAIPVETQHRIVDYLDRETGQIDETITRINRVIELMSERNRSLLRDQVLSERYPRVSLGLLTEISNGSTPSKSEPGYWSTADHSESVPWMSSTVVNQPTASTPTAFVTPRAVKECHLPTALPGDVLVAITGQGKTRGMATILAVETTLNQHVVSIRPNKKITSEFLVTALRALYDELRRESESNGSTRAAITIEQLERFQIPLPDLDKQVAISGEIASAQSNTELMLHKARHLRSLLEERRSALITAAVTGRIEV